MARAVLLPVLLLLAAPADADLRDEPEIVEGLIAIGIAYEIAEVCPSIAPHRLRGVGALLGLRTRAGRLGYSGAEIEAFTDDDVEKDRLEAVARQRLAALGAERGDVAAHCAVGRAAVAGGTPVGRLLVLR
jgi:hypothetical protein